MHARALGVLTAVETFDGHPGQSLRQHFVMVAVACQWLEGEPAAGDDAADARWFSLEALDAAELVLSFNVDRIARMASEASASI